MSASAANAAQRRPYGLACTACRRAKMKCISSGLEPNRCDRCVRQQKECLFESNRRGLWRRDYALGVSRLSDEFPQLPLPPVQDTAITRAVPVETDWNFSKSPSKSLPVPTTWDQRKDPQSPQDNFLPVLRGGLPDNSPSEGLSPSEKQSPSRHRSEDSSFAPPSFVSHSEDTRGLSLDAALDPERTVLDSTNSERTSISNSDRDKTAVDDPINLRILSRPSAQSLFADFFTHFNYLVGLLDPDLYTFSYTREASSLLFTVILSISSRVFRPDLHQALRRHVEMLLSKVLLACDSAVENIWATVCMYYWKDVGDKRGYTLVGFALRMASSAEWNKTRRRVASHEEMNSQMLETELQVRQRRDKDRVWLSVGNIDRTSSYFTDRPLSAVPIMGNAGSRDWLAVDKWTYANGDAKAIGGFELTNIARPVYDFMMDHKDHSSAASNERDHQSFQNIMRVFNDDVRAWGEHWAPIFAQFPQSEPCLESLVYFFRDYMLIYFNSVLLHRILVSNGNNVVDPAAVSAILTCYSSVMSLLRETISMGKMELLYFFWDTAHLMVAYAAMMLLKLVKQGSHIHGVAVGEARSVLLELATIHAAAAGSLTSSATGMPLHNISNKTPAENAVDAQSRLLRAIVQQLKTELLPIAGSSSLISSDRSRPEDGLCDVQNAFPITPLSTSRQRGVMLTEMPLPNPTSEPAVSEEEAFAMAQLTDEMDFSLDSSYMDARFMDVGLLSWDEPGVFIDPH